jgi:hypothetical protein
MFKSANEVPVPEALFHGLSTSRASRNRNATALKKCSGPLGAPSPGLRKVTSVLALKSPAYQLRTEKIPV